MTPSRSSQIGVERRVEVAAFGLGRHFGGYCGGSGDYRVSAVAGYQKDDWRVDASEQVDTPNASCPVVAPDVSPEPCHAFER